MDDRTRTLYLTRIDADGIYQNLFAFALADRTLHRLTNNNIPSLSFSGLEILQDGRPPAGAPGPRGNRRG